MEGQTDQIVHTLTLRWERLSQDSFSEFVDAGALLNEFGSVRFDVGVAPEGPTASQQDARGSLFPKITTPLSTVCLFPAF